MAQQHGEVTPPGRGSMSILLDSLIVTFIAVSTAWVGAEAQSGREWAGFGLGMMALVRSGPITIVRAALTLRQLRAAPVVRRTFEGHWEHPVTGRHLFVQWQLETGRWMVKASERGAWLRFSDQPESMRALVEQTEANGLIPSGDAATWAIRAELNVKGWHEGLV